MIGGGLGASLGAVGARLLPAVGLNVTTAAIVGMAAMFAGASHALLASVVFAFETTRQPMGLLPLLAGCSAAYLVSLLMAPHSIMTERLARRGRAVRSEYAIDYLARVLVRDVALKPVVTIEATRTVDATRDWLNSGGEPAAHQGFPVLDNDSHIVGVITRRDITNPNHAGGLPIADIIRRPPAVVFDDNTLREAADHMVREGVGRLPVVTRDDPRVVVGIVSRSDLLAAHHQRLQAADKLEAGMATRLRRRVATSRPSQASTAPHRPPASGRP
jgi:CBS domain-containing protein